VHRAPAGRLLRADRRDIVLGVARSDARTAAGATIEIDSESPLFRHSARPSANHENASDNHERHEIHVHERHERHGILETVEAEPVFVSFAGFVIFVVNMPIDLY
jgi:hypothetical protein